MFSQSTFGNVAEYSCVSGYMLIGNVTQTCSSNGNWSGIAPRCKAIPVPTVSLSSRKSAQATASSNPPTPGFGPRGNHPSEGSNKTLNLIIGSVIGLLLVTILLMCTCILVVYVRRLKLKRDTEDHTTNAAISGTHHNSVDNPVYTGQMYTLLKMCCYYSTTMCYYWDMSVK